MLRKGGRRASVIYGYLFALSSNQPRNTLRRLRPHSYRRRERLQTARDLVVGGLRYITGLVICTRFTLAPRTKALLSPAVSFFKTLSTAK